MKRAESRILTDDQIIELYWQRDESAIGETDKKYGKMLTRIAYNILHDKMDCEECKNDTYLGAWNTIPPTRPKVLPAYLTQLVRNLALNRHKQKARQRRVPTDSTVSINDLSGVLKSEEEVGQEDLREAINCYIRGLPERQRYIFIARFYLLEPVEAIAKELSISVATAYREIDRIRQDMKLYLERNDIYI